MLKAVLLAIFGGLIIVDSGPTSLPPLNAAFTARPVQGSTCVAPCAVHFDAVGKGYLSSTPYVTEETTDNSVDNVFTDLLFTWDFGDVGAGTWSDDGSSQNAAIGGIAGHTFYDPGTYTVTLTVKNPSGDTDSVSHDITVVDPDVQFSGTTFCVANGSTPTGGAGGCPTGATGVNQGDLDVAFLTNCNADAAKVRCLFKGGDTFTASTGLTHYTTGSAPGMVASYGTGKAIFSLGGNRLVPGQNWTWYNISASSTADFAVNNTYHNVSMIDVDMDYSTSCWSTDDAVQYEHPYLTALINFNCTAVGSSDVGMWAHGWYFLLMGGTLDRNFLSSSNPYVMRPMYEQHYLMSHYTVMGTPGAGNCFHFRSINRDEARFHGFDWSGWSDDEMATRFLQISDSTCESNVRRGQNNICVDSGCNCIQNSCAGVNNVSDIVIERNFFPRIPGDGSVVEAPFSFWYVEGADITLRNNVYDLQGGVANGESSVLVTANGMPTNGTSRPTSVVQGGNVKVYNETIYHDDAVNYDITVLQNSTAASHTGCLSECVSRNNLFVTPNDSAGTFAASSGTVTASNNLRMTTSPFGGVVPQSGLTARSDFIPAAGASTVVNAGYSITENFLDALGFCRPSSSLWDIGALEYGASACP